MSAWNETNVAPPGDFWSPALLVKLDNGTVRLGTALKNLDGTVHSWFWLDSESLTGSSCHSACYAEEIVEWRLAPTAEEIANV